MVAVAFDQREPSEHNYVEFQVFVTFLEQDLVRLQHDYISQLEDAADGFDRELSK